jgi:hypothetical protein
VATFELTGPDGATYHLDAPNESAAMSAFSQFTGKAQAPAPDKYQQAAQAEIAANPAMQDSGYTRRLAHGFTLGADNTALGFLGAIPEAIRHAAPDLMSPDIGKNWSALKEGYSYAKAREDELLNQSRQNTGKLGTAAEILGGVGAGGVLGEAGAASRLAPDAGLLKRAGAYALDNAALGAFSGAMEGNQTGDTLDSIDARFNNALKGGAISGLIGGGLPIAGAIAKGAASPVTGGLNAVINPERYATSQVARAVAESGQAPHALGQQIANANAAGAPYTLADALGNPGQRMLSNVTRAPGIGRTEAVNFLESRQAGQGERVGNIIDQALGAGPTARQTMDSLTQQARQASAPLYRQAMNEAPVWSPRMQQFFSDPITQQGLKEGIGVQRMESLASGKPFNPQDAAITGFNEAGDPIISGVPNMRTIDLIKKGWDSILEGYRDKTTGRLVLDARGRALDQVRRSFLKEVDSINPAYAQARAAYAGPAQVREAVPVGQQAATRGRAADNLDRFNRMNPQEQQGFRQGYADTLVGKAENGAMGVNKVRPLTSDKANAELQALSLHQGPVQPGQLDPLQQRLGYEQRMFETRNQALGNSKTAENLADEAAMGVDPTLVHHIITHNWGAALHRALHAGGATFTGNTAPVRAAVGKLLLQRGTNPAQIQQMVGDTVKRIQFVQNFARNLARGGAGALAVGNQQPSTSK